VLSTRVLCARTLRLCFLLCHIFMSVLFSRRIAFLHAALIDSAAPRFERPFHVKLLAFLRRHVYTRCTVPPLAQLLQRQYGYPMLRHRQPRYVHHRIEEPHWCHEAAQTLVAEVDASPTDA
jgi:hypothetical protein